MYKNYGIDISNMAEEEFERMKELYVHRGEDIDFHLKESEKYSGKFVEDIL